MDRGLIKKVEDLQDLLVKYSTGWRDINGYDYQELREILLVDPLTKDLIPECVKKNRDLQQFWNFIQSKFEHYRDRRTFLWDSFRPLLEKLESSTSNPVSEGMDETLKAFNVENVNSAWIRIAKRREEDPEAAITAARSMLESICKYILDETGIIYSDTADLPALYKAVAKKLNLAPDQHTEEIFKHILGGAQSVIQGLGALRNKLGDAHGKGRSGPKPHPRHAELAINMAGAMSIFLLETFDAKVISSMVKK